MDSQKTVQAGCRLFLIFLFVFIFSCSPLRKTPASGTRFQLQFLDVWELPYNFRFQGTVTGGLSGIDYDRSRDIYYLLSDDRSEINPARFYTARIEFTPRGFHRVNFQSVHYLRQPGGSAFPEKTADPESIRFIGDRLVWTSEGERILQDGNSIFSDPSIRIMDTTGNFLDSFPIPGLFRMKPYSKGSRKNGSFEGMTGNTTVLYVCSEEPLYEDGPRAALGDSAAWVRLLKYDMGEKKVSGQYAYRIDPVQHDPQPAGSFHMNGVSEILYLGDDRLLMVERSFSTGRKGSSIRVYLASHSKATDISGIPSLEGTSDWRPVEKTLLLDMDTLGIHIDNIEGVCFGPSLPDGRRTLVFVTDNNFSPEQVTQFFLFAIEEL